mgnify:CR=1 FL=1
MDLHSDLYGKALLDFHQGNYTEDIIVLSATMEDDVLPLPYLFRHYDQMPILEKKALQLSKGSVLVLGAGAGSHSLYLEETGLEITALDHSPVAVQVHQKSLQ